MIESRKPRKSAKKTLPENSSDTDKNTLDKKDYNNKITSDSIDPTPEIEKIIPVVEEDFDLTKKTVIHETSIVKRMATKTEKIEVPITYEEVYVNNKKLKIYDKEVEGILSKIKDTIAHSVSASASDDDNIEYHYPPSTPSPGSHSNSKRDQNSDYNIRGEVVALIEGQESNETEKIVPIWGEEIIVQKRKVKLGEIVIQKRRLIESKKIDIDIKREKVIMEYPDGRKEELETASTQERKTK
jgi:stress response protein YsnF